MTITDLKSALDYSQRKLGSLTLRDSMSQLNNTDGMSTDIEKWSLICQEIQFRLEFKIIAEFEDRSINEQEAT